MAQVLCPRNPDVRRAPALYKFCSDLYICTVVMYICTVVMYTH